MMVFLKMMSKSLDTHLIEKSLVSARLIYIIFTNYVKSHARSDISYYALSAY